MAQKKKQSKKNIKQQKQKQKQHQKQTVIVNVMTSKSRRGTRSKKEVVKNYKQPYSLIQSLPLQYTPYTMYDNSRLLTQEGRNRNQIFAPEIPNVIPMIEADVEIPNAIPIMAEAEPYEEAQPLGITTPLISPRIEEAQERISITPRREEEEEEEEDDNITQPNSPRVEEIEEDDATPRPMYASQFTPTYETATEGDETASSSSGDDSSVLFRSQEQPDYNLEPEPEEWNIKTRGVINATQPTQAVLWQRAQRNNLMPTPIDNSIDRLISNATDDEGYNMGDFYNVLSPSAEGEQQNPAIRPTPTSHRKTTTTNIDEPNEEEEESNFKTDKTGNGVDEFYIDDNGRYFCVYCNYSIQNISGTVKSHKNSKTHKANVAKQIIDNGDY